LSGSWGVEFQGVSFGWGREPLCAGLDLQVPLDGLSYRLPIVGPSGSGKSTLLYLLATLKRPDTGQMIWTFPDGEQAVWGDDPATDGAWRWIRQRRFGFAFQDATLLPFLTVEENLIYPLEMQPSASRLPEATRRGRVRDSLVQVLSEGESAGEIARRYPEQLSGGQRQRVALAQAMITQPTVLFADEPTGSLDPKIRGEVMEVVERWLMEEGAGRRAFVWITHHRDLSEFGGVGRVLQVRLSPGDGSRIYSLQSTAGLPRVVSEQIALEA